MVIPQDDHITVVFFPGSQLATGKAGRFLYDLVRGGSQHALGRLPEIASSMDIVLLKVSVVVPKPGRLVSYLVRDTSCHLLGQLAPSFEMDFIYQSFNRLPI